MRPDGSGRRVLARMRGARRSWGAAWSPDGRRIPVFSDDALWVMDADGRRLRRLIDTSGNGVAWSPDGRQIAFSQGNRMATQILVVNADGSGLRNLTENDGVHDAGPVWSPDGRAIAFTSDRDGNAEIYVMNADGSGQRNVSQSLLEDLEPAWSPKS